MIKRPNSRANLDRAIERLFGNYEKTLETRSIMANANCFCDMWVFLKETAG